MSLAVSPNTNVPASETADCIPALSQLVPTLPEVFIANGSSNSLPEMNASVPEIPAPEPNACKAFGNTSKASV